MGGGGGRVWFLAELAILRLRSQEHVCTLKPKKGRHYHYAIEGETEALGCDVTFQIMNLENSRQGVELNTQLGDELNPQMSCLMSGHQWGREQGERQVAGSDPSHPQPTYPSIGVPLPTDFMLTAIPMHKGTESHQEGHVEGEVSSVGTQ